MASLRGYGPQVAAAPPDGAFIGVSGPAAEQNAIQAGTSVIDGTPVRVVVLAFSAAAGLTALKWAGFRFNVGVSA
jgi:hypothetical protein